MKTVKQNETLKTCCVHTSVMTCCLVTLVHWIQHFYTASQFCFTSILLIIVSCIIAVKRSYLHKMVLCAPDSA
jgi:hypothetical protein